MASYSIQWRKSAFKELRDLPDQQRQRVVTAVDALAENPFPHGVKKLHGDEHTYRIRVGDYRVIYEVLRVLTLIEVQRVAHRKDAYRE